MRASAKSTMALLLILFLISTSIAGDLSSKPGQAPAGKAFPAEHLGTIQCKDPATGFDFSPLGVSFGLTDGLFITDSDNSQIFIVPRTLDRLDLFAECPGVFANCRLIDLDINGAGDLLVSEQSEGAVLTVDRWGEVAAYSEVGEGITGIACGPAGKLYAALGFPGLVRIADLNTQAEYIDCVLSEKGESSYPVDCLVTADDRVLVTDASTKKVFVLSPVGDLRGSLTGFDFQSPFGLAEFKGRIYVSDIELGLIAVFTKDGRFTGVFGQGLLEAPAFMDIRADGTLCVADAEKMTVEVFKLETPTAK